MGRVGREGGGEESNEPHSAPCLALSSSPSPSPLYGCSRAELCQYNRLFFQSAILLWISHESTLCVWSAVRSLFLFPFRLWLLKLMLGQAHLAFSNNTSPIFCTMGAARNTIYLVGWLAACHNRDSFPSVLFPFCLPCVLQIRLSFWASTKGWKPFSRRVKVTLDRPFLGVFSNAFPGLKMRVHLLTAPSVLII
jgi:hypothetical protein